MFSCFSACPQSDIDTFISKQVDICRHLWYFTPYSGISERWCDLVEGSGKRGRPAGFDVREGSLISKCPNWWEMRSNGKRFGIVLGILVISIIFISGCSGYWHHVGRKVDAKDKKRLDQRRIIMGLDEEGDATTT